MSSPAEILYELLLDNGKLSEDSNRVGFIGYLPDDPDEALTIFDTLGMQDGRIMETGERIDHPGLQITIRSPDYSSAANWAKDVALFLDGVKRISIVMDSSEAYCLQNVKRTGTINYLGVETEGTKRRHIFTLNMVVTLSQN